MFRRPPKGALVATALVVLASVAPLASATAATPRDDLPAQTLSAPACIATDGTNVCIVKSTTMPSCSGYSSQGVPPPTVRVLVHGSPNTVVTVDFRTYVKNVLPNEWPSSWKAESLKAGAVAVKSYAWYWVTHYGGYLKTGTTTTTCFDVTDDTNFQVYGAGSDQASTSAAVDQSWGVAARASGAIRPTGYQGSFSGSSTDPCGSGGNGSSMSQWGSQNCARAGYNFVKILEAYYRPVQLADTHQLLTPDDFTFTGRSTRAQWDPATGNWSINDPYGTVHHYGVRGDIPTVLNTGDGLATIGVFRPSTGAWYISGPSGGIAAVQHWGMAGDVPVPAHYNGAAAPSVLAIYRPSTGAWWVLGSPTLIYGGPGDIPVPGHYGSTAASTGHADGVAIFRPSTGTWYVRNVGIVHYGAAGDIPVPGDYNGDGITDVAVYRPSTHQWLVQGSAPITYGLDGDIPVTGDFNGDGKFDLAVVRPSTQQWFIRGQGVSTFGTSTGIPVGAAPYRD